MEQFFALLHHWWGSKKSREKRREINTDYSAATKHECSVAATHVVTHEVKFLLRYCATAIHCWTAIAADGLADEGCIPLPQDAGTTGCGPVWTGFG